MAKLMINSPPMQGLKYALLAGVLSLGVGLTAFSEAAQDIDNVLTLEKAVKLAQLNDPWLARNQYSQNSIKAMSVAAGTLPDPKVSIGLANFPVDGFDFSQEAMTQIKVGASQMFPRGDSLAIRKKQLELMASQHPYQRQDREAHATVIVGQLWLDTWKAQESIALIEKDRPLFEQLADVAQASYSSAVGKTRQQDIIRAQLELTRLDDRLTILRQRQEMSLHKLSEWLSGYFQDQSPENYAFANPFELQGSMLARKLPDTKLLNPQLFTDNATISSQALNEYFSSHVAVKALEQKIKASREGVELAKQKYKPEWGVNASYGYRDDDPMGRERADFMSVGVTFDVPIFTANRQDKEVAAASYQTEVVRMEKWLLLRKLIASFETARSHLLRLNERQELYQDHLLPQMREQAEASLTAYTNDDGDFAEVVRARIAELNANVDALGINVDRQKAIIQLNYFFMSNPDEIIASGSWQNETTGERK